MVPVLGGYRANTELHKSAGWQPNCPRLHHLKKLEVEVGHEHFGNVDQTNYGCA